MAIDPYKRRLEQEARDNLETLQDVPVAELLGNFSLQHIRSLDTYQCGQPNIDAFVAEPFQPEFRNTYEGHLGLLALNRSEYDDSIENSMFEDGLIQAAIQQKRKHDTPELARAIRVRRSVLAYLHSYSAEVVDFPDRSEQTAQPELHRDSASGI